MHIRIASIMLIASILGLGALAPLMTTQTSIAQPAGMAPFDVNTAVSEDRIVITITKTGAAAELPDTPIVIIPPNETAGEDNATILTPGEPTQLPVIPGEPVPPQNITIIEPDGNITEVPEGNITQTPGDVTVIDPPACGCPVGGEEEPPIAVQLPVIPGNNETTTIISNETTIEAPPAPTQLPAEPEGDGGDGNGNGNGNGGDGNGDGDGGG